MTIISDFYNVDIPRRSERDIRGRLRASNIPSVTQIGGDIYDGNKYTDVSIIKMSPASPVSTKTATTPTNISTNRLTRPTTRISSKNIGYTRNFRLQSRNITRAKTQLQLY